MNSSRIGKAFGAVLRDIRKSRRLTQERLAFAAGLDRTYISLMELGQRIPTLETMLALCAALDITFSELAALIELEILSQISR